ncbi:MAG: response regulator [Betaproteobacteria bacterium]|nr:response regulator [Betaproteobacteria bacterium]
MNEARKYSILVVDDEKSNILALMNILRPEYTVYASTSGQSVIETAEKHLPDIILLDIIMPDMDGYEVIGALKSSEKTRNIPVIFVTGLSGAADEEKGLALGVADYIIKPFSPAIVKLRVRNQIKLLEQLRAAEYDLVKYKLSNDALNISMWDMDIVSGDPVNRSNKITYSQEFRSMFGFSDETDFPNVLGSWTDRLHPEDKEKTINAFAAHMNDYTGQTPYNVEYRILMKNGTEYRHFHALGTTQRDSTGVPLRVSGAVRDITENKEMEETIKHREKLLNALNEMDIVLLSQKDKTFDDVMSDSLKPIAYATDLDRISIFRLVDANGNKRFGQVYRWEKAAGRMVALDDELRILPDIPVVRNWIAALSQGGHINIHASVMSDEETAFLNPYGVKSILMTPVSINGELWGGVAFQDLTRERLFDENSISFLNAVARLCANAIIKADMTQDTKKALQESNTTLDIMTNVLNKSDMMIYVTDKDTDEILFLNDAMKRHFEIRTDVIGSPCYKVFQEGMSERCDFCPCHRLEKEPGEIVVWEEHNTVTSRYYRNTDQYIDWPGGKTVHIQHSIDITGIKQTQVALEHRGIMLIAINRMAAILLNADIDSFESALLQSMKIMTEAIKTDRMYVWKNHSTDGRLCSTQIYEWSENARPLQGSEFTVNIPYEEATPGWEEILSSGNCINGLVREMPPKIQAHLSSQDILSILVIPVFIKGQFWGLVGFDDCHRERVFTDEEVSIMRSGGLLFADALFRNEMAVNIRDTSIQLKAAAEKALEDEERMQLMLDAMPFACGLINRDHQFTYYNQAAITMFGLPGRDNYAKGYLEVLPEFQPSGRRSSELSYEHFEQAFKEGYQRYEWLYRKPDGELVPCEESLIRVRHRGELILAAYARDLREQKAIIEEIRKAEAAKAASNAKSIFLANMSHEIRTPLNGVIGFAELALDEEDTPAITKEYLEKIKSSAIGLLDIVSDILDISKIESSKMELDKATFDLHAILHTCRTIVELKAEEKGIALHFYAEPLVGKKLVGDPVKLRQVLLNLLSNAIKFTNYGVVKLKVVAEKETAENVTISFEVKDSGIGMNSEQLKYIFEPFVRADAGTTRKYGGTGLGLAIAKGFVELMGGNLCAESAPGLGSRFYFTLPFDTIAVADDSMQKDTPIVSTKPVFSGDVLVCEDNRINQDVIINHLTRIGLNPTVAENGKQGVEYAKSRMEQGNPYDLILMDIYMPVMDGLEATQHLFKMGNKTPIIALTANVLATDRETYLQQGMADFLGKPFTSQELWTCLSRHLMPVAEIKETGQESKEESAPDESSLGGESQLAGAVLNEALGLQMTSDDIGLYRRIVGNFVEDYAGIVNTLNELVDSGDLDLVRRTAHTLKSTSRTIGAEKLANAAYAIEASLAKGDESRLGEQILALDGALQELFAALATVTDKAGQKPPQHTGA